MTELVSLSSSQHSSHTLGKKGIVGDKEEKTDETRRNKARKEKGQMKMGWTRE